MAKKSLEEVLEERLGKLGISLSDRIYPKDSLIPHEFLLPFSPLEHIGPEDEEEIGESKSYIGDSEDILRTEWSEDYVRRAQYKEIRIDYERGSNTGGIGSEVNSSLIHIYPEVEGKGIRITVVESPTMATVGAEEEENEREGFDLVRLKLRGLVDSIGKKDYSLRQSYAEDIVNKIIDTLEEI